MQKSYILYKYMQFSLMHAPIAQNPIILCRVDREITNLLQNDILDIFR